MSCFYPRPFSITSIFSSTRIAVLVAVIFAFITFSGKQTFAQTLTVTEATSTTDVNNLVNNTLIGSCVTVSNITYTGTFRAIGSFGNGAGAGSVGFGTGVLMTTGRCTNAPGPNNAPDRGTDNGRAGDATLTAAIGNATLDATVLEFDFFPLSDTLRFEYVFASEEYREYVNTAYNDAFGFFITGPGYPTPTNIALIPSTAVPVTINNVNNGNVGAGTCPATGPCEYCAYYTDNCLTTTARVQYDAWTTPLTAFALVQKCQSYHIKLVVADVGDRRYDSGVFLKANSFSGGAALSVDISTQSNPTGVWEGCNDAGFTFTKLNGSDLNTPITVSFTLSGTATSGTDYTSFPTSITIPAGSMSSTILIDALLDGLTEGNETIILTLTTAPCGCTAPPTATLTIQDNTTLTATSTGTQTICLGQSATLTATPSGSQGPYTVSWNNGAGTGTSVSVSPTNTTTYTATISDVCNGQTVTRSETVTVIRSDYTIGTPTTQCLTGNSFSFTHTGSTGGGFTYSWNFGDGTPVVNTQNATHTYAAGGTYTVTHTTNNGVCTSTSTQTVTVNANPTATITGTNNFCTGGSTVLSAATSTAGSGSITGYQWRLNGSKYWWSDICNLYCNSRRNIFCDCY
jgi:PKD repeat protein